MKMVQVIMNKLPKNINHRKSFLISLLLIVVGSLLTFYIHPRIVKAIIKFFVVAKPGRYVRSKHELEQPFLYKLYLWNVTNPNQVSDGTEKPKMQEVGPYVFSETKQKVNLRDNNTDDTLTFNFLSIFHFDPVSSAPLTGNEVLNLINAVIAAAIVKVKIELPHLMNIATESLDIIFENPSSIFVTMTAMDFIDNGIRIDCNQTAYAAKVACSHMRRHRMLTVMNDDKTLIRYRWFDRYNDTLRSNLTEMRGSKNIHDAYRVIRFNDSPLLKFFKQGDQCNILNGTDKVYTPPYQQRDEVAWVFSEDACKSFPLRYKYMKSVRGVKTAYKFLNLSDPLWNPECECNKYIGCTPPGTINMFDCLDIFSCGSLPHFYLADSSIRENIEGMNPRDDLHETGLYIDLVSGAPVLAKERFQINFLVTPIPEHRIFSKIADDMWIPLLWFEERFSIAKADLGLIYIRKISQIIGLGTGYMMLSSGIVGCVVTVAQRIHQHLSVTPDVPTVEHTE